MIGCFLQYSVDVDIRANQADRTIEALSWTDARLIQQALTDGSGGHRLLPDEDDWDASIVCLADNGSLWQVIPRQDQASQAGSIESSFLDFDAISAGNHPKIGRTSEEAQRGFDSCGTDPEMADFAVKRSIRHDAAAEFLHDLFHVHGM